MVKTEHKKSGESKRIQKTTETTGDTAFAVLNKLAGDGNTLKVAFDNLTIGQGSLQATING